MGINYTRYSADVTIHVERDGEVFQVAQLGPDFLVLESTDEVDGAVELVLSVDGVICRRDVRLSEPDMLMHEGTPGEKKIVFAIEDTSDPQPLQVRGETNLSVHPF